MNQNLAQLLSNTKYELRGELPAVINRIKSDSREVTKGDLFIAVRGLITDGHKFLSAAGAAGASAVIVEDFSNEITLPQIKVDNSKNTLLKMIDSFYEHPTEDITVVGITGTNGKTTTTYLIHEILRRTGHNAGTIGTYGYSINDKKHKTNLTTPDIVQLFEIFHQMRQSNIEYVIMEVSSHSIAMDRIEEIKFNGAAFTNISRDHLDFHKTIDNYAQKKAELFSKIPRSGFTVINAEDQYAKLFENNSRAANVTYSIHGNTDYSYSEGTTFSNGINGRLLFHDKIYDFHSPLSGEFNMKNLLAAVAVCHNLNIPMVYILNALREIAPPPGRLEEISTSGPTRVFVDYAHTPDAIENALSALREIVPAKGRLIAVFGCGGNRDQTKRPLMAKAAEKIADFSILTTDNPRFEAPEAIIADAQKGFKDSKKYTLVIDRTAAIKKAITLAGDNDIVAILGKGHETYQDIKGQKHYFDDGEIAKEILNAVK